MPAPKRSIRRRPGSAPKGPDESVVPSFTEMLSLLAPFAGAGVGWWIGSEMGTLWHGLLGGIIGTGLGALYARRSAPDILR